MKRITIPKKHLKFMGFQVPAGRGVFLGPPVEPSLGKALVTKPKPLGVIA
jgi:hypothetical protein